MGGTKKKKIECPVVGRTIKPAECGENRVSEYDCPADCPQNPWNPANYGWASELYDRYMDKLMTRLRTEHTARYGYPKKPPLDEGSDEFDFLQWFSGQFFRERDADGQTFVQRWAAERYRGLNNDQRVLLEAESRMHPAVLEIQQVRDAESVVAVDLLDPDGEPFVVFDRSFAASACRFSTLFSVVYPMPHYTRIHSAAIPLPDVSGMGMQQVFSEIAAHLGVPTEPSARNGWLMENLRRVVDSIQAVSAARYEAMLSSLDAAYTKTVYELHCTPEKFGKVLEGQDGIELEDVLADDVDSGFVSEWVCLGGDSPAAEGQLLVGRILLHADGYVQLEASSEKRTRQLKERVEGLFGDMLEFSRERTDDMAAQLADKRALQYDAALVPPSLLDNPQQVETTTSRIPIPEEGMAKDELELHAEQGYMKTFLDNGIPLLDGLTPRQAAADPAQRPKLVELMKSHVRSHDENNLRTGRSTDINWVLDELGLDEINFPPPPQREPPEGYEDDGFDAAGEPSILMLTSEYVADRQQELETYDEGLLEECFSKAYPGIEAIILDMVRELGLDHEKEGLLRLAAETVFLQLDPSDQPVRGLEETLVLEHLDMLVEDIDTTSLVDIIDGELMQPEVALMQFRRLKQIMRFGENDPNLLNCLMLFIAISEAADQAVAEIMLQALEKLNKER